MRVFAGTALVILAAIFFAAVTHTLFQQPVQEYQASLPPAYPIFAWFIPVCMGAAGVVLLASNRKQSPAPTSFSGSSMQQAAVHTLEAAVATPSPPPDAAVAPAVHMAPTAAAQATEQLEPEPPKRVLSAPKKVTWVLPSVNWMLDPAPEPPTQEAIDSIGRRYLDWLCIYNIAATYVGGTLTESHVNYTFSGSTAPQETGHKVEGKAQPVPIHEVKSDHLLRMLSVESGLGPGRIVRPAADSDMVVLQVARTDLGVSLRRLMKSWEFKSTSGALVVPLGEDLDRRPVVVDLAKLPHLFVGGTTGSGKSVFLNSVVTSLLLTHAPDSLRLLLLDPGTVELGPYNGAPHLLSPVFGDASRAASVLYWADVEIRRRAQLFGGAGVSNLVRYNAVARDGKLPYVVVVIDEFGALMLDGVREAGEQLCRVVERGRAAGIHVILSTNAPASFSWSSRLLANISARVVFRVATAHESSQVLNTAGAERFASFGEAIFTTADGSEPTVIRTPLVSDTEIWRLVNFWKSTPAAPAEA